MLILILNYSIIILYLIRLIYLNIYTIILFRSILLNINILLILFLILFIKSVYYIFYNKIKIINKDNINFKSKYKWVNYFSLIKL